MSRHWCLRCADCGDDCGEPSINHGEETLREMAALGTHLLALPGEDRIDYELMVWDRYVPMQFLRRHRGHRLELRSEYGETAPLVVDDEPQDEAAQLARWLGEEGKRR